MRALNTQEMNSIAGGIALQEFVNMSMYYGSGLGTTFGAIAGAIKIATTYNYLWMPVGFIGGGLAGAAAGIACGAIAAIPLSAIFCPPDFAKLNF